ncbi:MAG: hypothetical protein PWP23_175 [Candidatus Sumerlaeota bacterium]|nr:hypothetical protein [Candidatus Sumerlaeota bacterium]
MRVRSARNSVFLGALLGISVPLVAQTFTENGLALLGTSQGEARSASFADIDNDGDLDLLFNGQQTSRRLYRNELAETGTASFTDVTIAYGLLANDTTGWSAAWADIDGDWDVDVFLGESNLNGATGDLFENRGVEGFADVSATTIDDPGFHQNVAWVDIDNDLDLDLVIGMEGPEMHEIYLQEPMGTFTPVGQQVGLHVGFGSKAYGMAIGDADADGDLDIYIATCRAGGDIRNNFFENRLVPDGTLSFIDIADSNGTQFRGNAYASEFADFDDDGDLDLYMTGADGEETKLWRNNGDGTWTDVATLLGKPLLSSPGRDLNGGRAIDYDNDGDLDLCFQEHFITGATASHQLYRNDGNWNFTLVSSEEGIDTAGRGGYDSAWGDFDNDGDLDMAASTGSSYNRRFYVSNASTNGNHWLFVRLKGRVPNTRAIGAQLYATVHAGTPQERTLRRDANTNAGAFNQSDVPVHFGLGDASSIDRLEIRWPFGEVTVLTDVAVDRYLTLSADSDTWSVH